MYTTPFQKKNKHLKKTVDQKFFLELPATRKYTNKHAE
jgi:hypothetical protein